MGLLLARSTATGPTRNLFFEGIETRKVSLSLAMSNTVVPTTGACPITRIFAGRAARRNALTSWYSSITPLYFEPAVGFSSTVAFKLFVLRAIELYCSRSSSRVASFTTGLAPGPYFVVFLIPPPVWQPREIAASVTRIMHVCMHCISQFHPHSYK